MISFAFTSGHLYTAADAAGDGGCLLFFLPSAAGGLPAQFTADQAWDPAEERLGTFLFLKTAPGQGEWAALEAWAVANLRTASATQTGFAWLSLGATGPALTAALPLGRDVDGPVVQTKTAIPMPSPLSSLPLPAGMRAVAKPGAEGLDSIAILPPPLQAARGQPAGGAINGAGLAIPLAGPLRGCCVFEGLYNVDGPDEAGDGARTLDLYEVVLDPLVPWGGRTAMTITGISVLLADKDGTIVLSPDGVTG